MLEHIIYWFTRNSTKVTTDHEWKIVHTIIFSFLPIAVDLRLSACVYGLLIGFEMCDRYTQLWTSDRGGGGGGGGEAGVLKILQLGNNGNLT